MCAALLLFGIALCVLLAGPYGVASAITPHIVAESYDVAGGVEQRWTLKL